VVQNAFEDAEAVGAEGFEEAEIGFVSDGEGKGGVDDASAMVYDRGGETRGVGVETHAQHRASAPNRGRKFVKKRHAAKYA
jgi:hypothetical protein